MPVANKPKPNKWFDLVASVQTSAPVKLYLYGDIGWYDIDAQTMLDALAPYAGRDIELHILSDGGSVAEGQAIYAALKDHQGKVTGIIDSVCASIASFIAMACDELYIRSFAQIMIHEAHGGAYGSADELRTSADMFDSVNDAMAEAFAAKSGKSVEDVRADMTSDFWLRGQAAVDYGLCDGLYGGDAEPQALNEMVASIGGMPPLKHLAALNAPQELIALFGEQSQWSGVPTEPQPENPTASKGTDMTEEEKKALRAQILQASKQRRDGIRAAFKPHLSRPGVSALLETCIDDDDCTPEQASIKLLAALSVQDEGDGGASPRVNDPQATNGKPKERLAQVLQAKMGAKVNIDKDNPYQYMGTVEAVRACMKDMGRGGEIAGKTQSELLAYSFNNTTSQFSDIFVEGIKLIIHDETATLQPWHLGFVKRIPMDFGRPNALIETTDKEAMRLKTENGEFKKVTLKAGKQSVWLDTYGIEIAVTRELLQADNLGLIQSEISDFIRVAEQLPQELLIKMLLENIKLDDDKPIFSEEANNLFGGAMSEAKMAEMSGEMIDQQTDQGRSLGLIPKAIISSGRDQKLHKAIISAPEINNTPNVAYEAFEEAIADGMLARKGKSFTIADPKTHTSIVQGYNKEADGIQVETKQPWLSDGMTVRIWTDVALNIVSRKGLQCHDVNHSTEPAA
ncbi:Clp protease ClpP [Vibrio brasiliensis]|uniref:head maturation protease, ClpP-related n=1 Tax=Vibrio brasiliensis TaxID=170652 RepID=UPI001EFC95A4|nr:head maturation protease, ClpP-related [Vibrio brasiliensis]MCG9785400.1 Clp protease ClpP [Vibrio brasiliensis]